MKNTNRREFIKTLPKIFGFAIVGFGVVYLVKEDPDLIQNREPVQTCGFNDMDSYQGHWHNVPPNWTDGVNGTPRTGHITTGEN